MNDNLSILIKAVLDGDGSKAGINAQLKTLAANVDKLKIRVTLSDEALQSIQNIVAGTKNLTASTQQTNQALQQQGQQLASNRVQADKYTEIFVDGKRVQKITEETLALGKQHKLIQSLSDDQQTVTKEQSIISDNYKKQRDEVEKLANAIGRVREQSEKRRAKDDRSAELAQTKAINAALEREFQLQQSRLGIFDQLKGRNLDEASLTQVINQLYSDRIIRTVQLDQVTGEWSVRLSETAQKDRVLRGEIDKINGSLYANSSALTDVTTKNQGFMYELGVAIKRIPVWMLGMTMFYQSLRFFTKGVAWVNELNRSLSEIAIVASKSQTEVAALGREFNTLAIDMAVTTKQIADASVTFYRQGLSQAEIMERVAVATKLAKVANIEFAESSEIVTSITNGLGISAERASDVLIAVGDSTATSASELGSAMQKVSGTAGALGIEFEYLVAQISTISARTRESADSIGNSLKTIYQRMVNLRAGGFDEEDGQNINDVAKALATVNIATTDSEGNFRNLKDILDELGAVWNTLDNRTQSYISTAMAGVRQASRFLTLMEGQAETVDMYNVAMEAAGTTQESYNRYLQSTEAYLNRLKATGEGVWQKVFDSEDIRGVVSSLTSLVNVIDKLIDLFGFLPTVILPATIALTAFSESGRGLVTGFGSFILKSGPAIISFFKGVSTAATSASVAATAAGTASGAAVGMGALFASFAPTALGIAGVTALSFGLQKLINKISETSAKQRELKQQNDELLLSYTSHSNKIDELVNRYATLSDIRHRTTEQEIEYIQIQNDLNDLLPVLTSRMDDNGNAHLRNVESVKSEIAYLQKLKKLQSEEFIHNFTKNIEQQTKAINDLTERAKELSLPKTYSTITGEEIEDKRIERERELIQVQRELAIAQGTLSESYVDLLHHELNMVGVTEQLSSAEIGYISTLAREKGSLLENNDVRNKLISQVISLVLARDQLNSLTEDASKHLNIEQTAISNVLTQLGIQIDLTNELTDATKDLAREQLKAKFVNAGLYTSQGYGMGVAYANAKKDLEKAFAGIDKLFNTVRGKVPDGDNPTKSEFLKSFDLSLAILEQVNAEVDTLKDTLKYITDEEEKRNFINEKLAPAYRKQLSVLTDVAGMQSDMLNDAKSSLKSLVSDEMYQKIISGDYSTIDIKSEKIADAIDRVRDLTSAFYDTQSSIRDVNGALVQLGIDADAVLQQQYDDWVRQAENAAEQVINAYKEYYKQQKDMKDKSIQDQIDKEDRRHSRIIDQLDEELDSYERIINAKLRLLDDAANEEDYAKRLNKAQQERAEIQKQIDILQMDDSIAARAKVSELKKQLTEKDESIFEMQTNRERDLRKQSLQDQLSDYKDKIGKQKNLEDDSYNAEKKQLQESREQWKGYYDNLINNEREWSKIRKDILSGDQAKINAIMSDLQNKNSSFASGFTSSLTEIGNSIKANLIDNLTKAIGLIREIAGNPIPSPPSSGGSSGKSSGGSSTDTIEEWGHTYEIKDNGYLIFKNGTFVPADNFKYLPNSVLERAREMKQNAASYDTGGMTPAWGSDPKLALLHEKELILNKNETSDFLKGLQILRNVIPQIVPTQTTTTNNNTPVTVNMNVSVKGGKNTGQDIVKQFITGLQRVGVPVT